MTQEEHRQRHRELHNALDELVADWAGHTRQLFSEHSIMELMKWSHQQTTKPDSEAGFSLRAKARAKAEIPNL